MVRDAWLVMSGEKEKVLSGSCRQLSEPRRHGDPDDHNIVDVTRLAFAVRNRSSDELMMQ